MNKEIDHKEILELGNSLSNAELAELITQQSHRLWGFEIVSAVAKRHLNPQLGE